GAAAATWARRRVVNRLIKSNLVRLQHARKVSCCVIDVARRDVISAQTLCALQRTICQLGCNLPNCPISEAEPSRALEQRVAGWPDNVDSIPRVLDVVNESGHEYD